MELFLIIATFILGAIIGSFLNVTIYRHNTGRGFGGRSICMSCSKTLDWHELVPIFSYLFYKGKCSKCQSKISPQYPLVELVTGAMFASIFYFLPHESLQHLVNIIFYWSIFSILIMISVYDIRHKIIPNAPVYTFIALTVLSPVITGYGFGFEIFNGILAGLLLSTPFALLWILSNGRLMGLGDAKIVLGLGILLGLSQGLASVLLAFWLGAILGLVLLGLKKSWLSMKSEIPFGPFLVFSAFISLISGFDLVSIANLFQSIF